MYKENWAYDCSEIADDFFDTAGGKGEVLEITGNKKINVSEYGETISYEYHQVYSDGKYIYDPRYSDVPVLKEKYLNEIKSLNNGSIVVKKVR